MGAGKTTVGRVVAARLGRPFLDSDDQVVARAGRTVAEIWRAEGEAAFRTLESEVLAEALASRPAAVIAAAGGSILDPVSRARLVEGGRVVWLRARSATTTERVGTGVGRPLLDRDPAGELDRLGHERDDLYTEVASSVVDVDDLSVEQVCERVLAAAGLSGPSS